MIETIDSSAWLTHNPSNQVAENHLGIRHMHDLGNGPFVRSWALPRSGRRHAVQELRGPVRGCGLKFHRVFSVDEDKHPLTVLLGPVTPNASEMAAADCLRTETYWIGARVHVGTEPDLSAPQISGSHPEHSVEAEWSV